MWRSELGSDRLTDRQVSELELLDRILSADPATCADEAQAPLVSLVAAVRDAHPPLRPGFTDQLAARLHEPAPAIGGRPAVRLPGGRRLAVRRPGGRLPAVRLPAVRRPAARRAGRLSGRLLTGVGAAASVALAAVVILVAGGLGSGSQTLVSEPGTPGLTANPTTARVGGAAGASAGVASSAPGTEPSSAAAGGSLNGTAGGVVSPSPTGAHQSATPPATSPAGPVPSVGGPRAVESDATLALLAPDGRVQEVTDAAIAAADRLGGIVESSDVSLEDAGGSQATLALEVPSAELEASLAALSRLAHVSSREQSGLDITDATGAARDRLAESRAERDALLRELGRATGPNQVSSIHDQLAIIDGRLGKDEAAVQTLVQRARYASVNVTIGEAASTAGGGGGSAWTPSGALGDALSVLEGVFGVLVIGLAGLAPAVVIGGLAWWATRALRRHRRASALVNAG
jgi:hypothetical protein